MSLDARFVVKLNIMHYRGLLKTEKDPIKLRIIAGLLAEEEAKLLELNRQPGKVKDR